MRNPIPVTVAFPDRGSPGRFWHIETPLVGEMANNPYLPDAISAEFQMEYESIDDAIQWALAFCDAMCKWKRENT